MRHYLWESEYYRSVVCGMSISGFLLGASKDREVSFMNSFYLFKLSGCESFHVNLM